MRLLVFLLGLTLLTSACRRETEPPLVVDYAYFPLTEGSYIDYRVDSVLFSDFTMTRDTAR